MTLMTFIGHEQRDVGQLQLCAAVQSQSEWQVEHRAM